MIVHRHATQMDATPVGYEFRRLGEGAQFADRFAHVFRFGRMQVWAAILWPVWDVVKQDYPGIQMLLANTNSVFPGSINSVLDLV